jgi:transcriptional regulator with XRE-family HTH domain
MSAPSLTDLHASARRLPEYAVHEMMDQVRYQLRRRMDETKTTQAALAAAMGVKPPVVSRLLRAAENTSLLTIARAARALGLTFTAVKFVPDADADLQMDEFGPFLRTEGRPHAWWPRTGKPGAHAWRHAGHGRAVGAGPNGLGYTASAHAREGLFLATLPRAASLDEAALETV